MRISDWSSDVCSSDLPVLPMGLGYVEGVTHDYVRHGTTTLFAARNVANGQVMSRVRTQHRHQEFLDFLHQIDQQTPPELDLHLIVATTSRTSAARSRPGAGTTPQVALALHAHLQFLAQSGRALVCPDHRAGHSAQLVHQRAPAMSADRAVRAALQRRRQFLPVRRHGRFDPAEDRTSRETYFCDRKLVIVAVRNIHSTRQSRNKAARSLWEGASSYSTLEVHIEPLGSILKMSLRSQGCSIGIASLYCIEDHLVFFLDSLDLADKIERASCGEGGCQSV